MALLQEWRDYAYAHDDNTQAGQQFWLNYFNVEKGIYQQLLKNPDEVVEGTVQELADKYETTLQLMVGFLDGINDSLKEANPIETMTKDTEVSLDFDNELLYKNMVAANAEWLYNLEQWNDIFSEEKRKELFIQPDALSGDAVFDDLPHVPAGGARDNGEPAFHQRAAFPAYERLPLRAQGIHGAGRAGELRA